MGISLLTLVSASAELPASAPADLEVINYRPVIAFDDTVVDENVVFSFSIPYSSRDTDRPGYEVWLTYSMASPNAAKNIKWLANFEKCISDDMSADNWAAAGSELYTNPVVPTAAYTLQTVVIVFTFVQSGDPTGAEYVRLRITRGTDDGLDDAAGDAYLASTEIRIR